MGINIVIDEIDRKILDVLQVEGRITNLELAERVGLSSAPCMRARQDARGYRRDQVATWRWWTLREWGSGST